MIPDYVKIKENSFRARIARLVLRSDTVAMVWGRRILLSGASSVQFCSQSDWVRHELVHVAQFQRFGFYRFLWLYALESLRHGYHDNKYEQEARAAEMYDDVV